MKSLMNKCWIIILIISPITASAQSKFELKDVAGKIKIEVLLEPQKVSYSVTHEEDKIVNQSDISMTLTNGTTFGLNPKLKKSSRRTVDETIKPVIYKKNSIHNNYNELTLDFEGYYSLIFRAYEDGVAYRFVSHLKDSIFVEKEQVNFNFPDNPTLYVASPKGRLNDGKTDPFFSCFQNTYEYKQLSLWNNEDLAFLPILVERGNSKKVCITEADLLNYPGLYLKNNSKRNGLEGVFAAYPKRIVDEVRGLKGVVKSREAYIAKVKGNTAFPWRVMVISSNDTDLLNNDLVYKLATPEQFSDFSWIKPGKVAWDWWNDWNIYNVNFKAGVNNETYKYFIDFASTYGFEYVILDEGWSVPGKADLLQVVPEIDLKELIRYAKDKKVDLILWAGYRAFEKDMENVCKHYAAMGIKGFKIDFMDRDDQAVVEFHHKCSQIGAKYKLLIDFHGTYKPTGLQRTYPNTINFEGVHGLEELKWAKPGTDQVTYDVTMPFIRMVAGPLDYTQGAMNNSNKENFKAIYSEPMSQGTRCRQLALYAIFDSPLSMLCDAPTNYLKEDECTKFISAIPTVWDRTVPVSGKIGEHIIMARQKDDVWYVGGITDWNAQDIEIDLSFLGNGSFSAEVFKDGINADRVAKDYKHEIISISSDKKVKIHMAPGGGFIMKIIK